MKKFASLMAGAAALAMIAAPAMAGTVYQGSVTGSLQLTPGISIGPIVIVPPILFPRPRVGIFSVPGMFQLAPRTNDLPSIALRRSTLAGAKPPLRFSLSHNATV